MHTKHKRLAEKFAEEIYKELETMQDWELKRAIRDCDSLTDTNCGWLEYDMRKFIKESAENILGARKYLSEKEGGR